VGLEDPLGERKSDLLCAVLRRVALLELALADDAAHLDPARHRVRTDLELGGVVEVEPDLVVGKLDAVAVEPRELDPQLFAALNGTDLDDRLRRQRVLERLVGGDELEWDAVDV